MPKRATLPEDTFGKPTTSALDRLTSATPAPPLPREEPALKREKFKKMSIYVTLEQEAKLNDLARAHRRATGESTNKIEVVRMLIEKATLDTIL